MSKSDLVGPLATALLVVFLAVVLVGTPYLVIFSINAVFGTATEVTWSSALGVWILIVLLAGIKHS